MRFAIVGVVICASSGARADDEVRVLPCRPTLGCTADFALPGVLEVELGYQLRRAAGAFQHVAPVFAKLTLAHWIQLQAGSDVTYAPGPPLTRYVDNISLLAKLHLVDQTARRPSLALSVGVAIPTASQPGYTRTYDLLIVAHASKDLGKLHLDGVVGLETFQIDGPAANQPWTTVAATLPIDEHFSVAIEPHYFAAAPPFATRDVGSIATIVYAPRGTVAIDAGFDVVGWDQRSVSVIVGVSIAPTRLWK